MMDVISLTWRSLILYMGYKGIRYKGFELKRREEKPRSLSRGMLVNALNPHPYLFWLTVGAPIIAKTANQGLLAPSAFVASFYVFLVESKMVLALLVGKSKSLLADNWYI